MSAALENMNCVVVVGRRFIKELRDADDITLITKSMEEMAELLNRVVEENTKMSL